jgi:hypothetical protein
MCNGLSGIKLGLMHNQRIAAKYVEILYSSLFIRLTLLSPPSPQGERS